MKTDETGDEEIGEESKNLRKEFREAMEDPLRPEVVKEFEKMKPPTDDCLEPYELERIERTKIIHVDSLKHVLDCDTCMINIKCLLALLDKK